MYTFFVDLGRLCTKRMQECLKDLKRGPNYKKNFETYPRRRSRLRVMFHLLLIVQLFTLCFKYKNSDTKIIKKDRISGLEEKPY